MTEDGERRREGRGPLPRRWFCLWACVLCELQLFDRRGRREMCVCGLVARERGVQRLQLRLIASARKCVHRRRRRPVVGRDAENPRAPSTLASPTSLASRPLRIMYARL
jgi:hypothetical protein